MKITLWLIGIALVVAFADTVWLFLVKWTDEAKKRAKDL